MARYNAPTNVPFGARIVSQGTYTAVGSQPPVWTNMPTSFTKQQGTSEDLSTKASSPQFYTLVFRISAGSSFDAVALQARGITLASNGLLSIASNATLQTTSGIKVDADDQHGGVTPSPAFDVVVTAVQTATPWTLYRGYHLTGGINSGNSQIVPTSGLIQTTLGPYTTYALARAAVVDSATNPDIIAVVPGNYPSDAIGVDKNCIIICANGMTGAARTSATGWDVTAMANTNNFGDATMTALSNKSVWIEGLRFAGHKATSCSPSGGANCVAASVQNTQTLTMKNCVFEENACGLVSGAYCGNMTFIDTEFKDNGLADSVSQAGCHHIYLAYGISNQTPLNPNQSATFIGCKWWTSQDWCSYQSGQEWKVGNNHFLKCDLKALTVQGCYFRTTSPGGGGSTGCKIQGDSGGLWFIDGNIIEEGRYSNYDPTSTSHGITPYTSGGFPKCPATAVSYTPNDHRIVDMALAPQGGGIFTAPWPVSELHMRQNTFINNGLATEKVHENSYLTAGVPGSGSPSVVEIKDNVVARNAGTADTDPELQVGSTTNSILANNSVFVNAAAENYALSTPVAGSAANAPYEFVFPIGHRARTDSYRGGVAVATVPTTKPLWWRNPRNRGTQLQVGEWHRFDSSTLDAVAWNTADGVNVVANVPYPLNLNQGTPNNNGVIYSCDRDPVETVNCSAVGITLDIRDAEKAMGAGGQGNFGFRQNGSWIIWMAGGHRSSISNGTHAFKLNTDFPKYEQFDTCSDYKAAIGPRLTTGTLTPATYSGTTMTQGDITTAYMYMNPPNTGAAPNQYFQYYYDERPVIGHLGWNLQYDQIHDRLLRVGGGAAYITAGSSQLDVMDWATKRWRAPNKSANATNPKQWYSNMGQSATNGTVSDNSSPTPIQGNAGWGLGKAIDPRNGTLYMIDSSNVWVVAPLDANDTYMTGRTRIAPNGGFKILPSGGVIAEGVAVCPEINKVFYMDSYPAAQDTVNHLQKLRLCPLDISTNPPTSLPGIDVKFANGTPVGWAYPPSGQLGAYQTFNALVWEPVLGKLLYFDNFFSDLTLNANLQLPIFLNTSGQPSEEDGSHVHIYQIDPTTGVATAMDTIGGTGTPISTTTVTGMTDPYTGRPLFPPPGNTLGGTSTTNNCVYSEELEGIVYVSGCTRPGRDGKTYNLSGGHSIYFIRTH